MVAGKGPPAFGPPQAPEYMGAAPYTKSLTSRYDYHQSYRNEKLSRIITPRYEWGMLDIRYTAPSGAISNDKFLKMPMPEFSMLDKGRAQEVDNLYIACQNHRDQYKDHSRTLQPMDYFKPPTYLYQCPTDPTSTYLKYPDIHVEYKKPAVFPLTLERSYRSPLYPDRALTGIYNPTSDISYKR
ncbi:unnamed protein product [Brassicogethes aeneus]|uniref:Uncharacterized protein n=1 Tax=Brassicogethes aeneus TaxID=1431903 RepID=A0A9P0B085_BRAAE|nr:unnamed protein product [Brassicogethes aeneus]